MDPKSPTKLNCMNDFWTLIPLLALAGCVTTAERTRAAASTWLNCPASELTEKPDHRFAGCGDEAVCTAGYCRSTIPWQQRFDAVSARFETQFACPASSQLVTEREGDYVVQGCGKSALCGLNAPCTEFHDLPTLLARARESFSKETGCATADVSVVYQADGFRAVGCDRAANCMKAEGPCIAIPMPSCTDVAEQRYDDCLVVARNDGVDANDKLNGYRRDSRQILQSVEGTVMANRLMEECRFRYERALTTCTAKVAR
jgi:hypothetical protein